MTGSTIQVESSNMQNILIALVVICAIVYAFIEFRKVNTKINELEQVVGKLQQALVHPMMMSPQEIKEVDVSKDSEQQNSEQIDSEPSNEIEITSNTTNDIMNTIINQVEQEVSPQPVQPFMNGLFISVKNIPSLCLPTPVEKVYGPNKLLLYSLTVKVLNLLAYGIIDCNSSMKNVLLTTGTTTIISNFILVLIDKL